MRRDVLYRSASKIKGDLLECEISEFLKDLMDKTRGTAKEANQSATMSLTSFYRYSLATHSYTEDEVELCKILAIDNLLDVSYWESLSSISSPREIHEILLNVNFAIKQLPKILELSKQDYVQEIKNDGAELPEELKGKELLSLIIVEESGQFSSPLRLTKALAAISDLYSAIATIENEAESDLIVLACDSGSDKSFDFLGLAKVMEQVKEIIIAIWDRRVFHRQRHMSESLTLISESLPILEKINDLKTGGTIGPEQAEILKRKIITGTTQFIEAGAVIAELESVSTHSPRQLMRPEPKLLVSPWSDEKQEDDSDSLDPEAEEAEEDILTEEEQTALDLLLRKSKKKRATKKKSTTKKKKST